MTTVVRWGWMPLILGIACPTQAQHHASASLASHVSHGHPGHHVSGMGGPVVFGGGLGFPIGAVGGGYASYGYGYGVPYYNPSPIVLMPPIFPAFPAGQGGGGLMLPMPPARLGGANSARPRRPSPDRAKELVEIGDRSFRAGNTRRAEEKFLLAARADNTSAIPHLHLAQVALVRKNYSAAAERIRTAVAAAPGTAWIRNVPDIQALYAEPGDFARHLAEVETHLQANPGDRDAWFVLGVEWYLSGRVQKAGDAFTRLSDRRPDDALAAFIDASTPPGRAAN